MESNKDQGVKVVMDKTFNVEFDFNTSGNNYNPKNNYLLAKLCSLVYEEKNKIDEQVKTWPEKGAKYLNVKIVDIEQTILNDSNQDNYWKVTSRFMVLSNQEFIILTFRGTSNIMELLSDFQFKLTPFEEGKGKVHYGFYKTVKNMRTAINDAIEEVRKNKQPIFITGHSLGGAQALLSALMCEKLKEFAYITTFGQPRVGDKNFSQFADDEIKTGSLKVNYYRMVNKKDPVANLPYFSYYHVGSSYINCNKDEFYNIVKGKTDTLIDPKLEKFENVEVQAEAIDNFLDKDHKIDLYVKNAKHNKKKKLFIVSD